MLSSWHASRVVGSTNEVAAASIDVSEACTELLAHRFKAAWLATHLPGAPQARPPTTSYQPKEVMHRLCNSSPTTHIADRCRDCSNKGEHSTARRSSRRSNFGEHPAAGSAAAAKPLLLSKAPKQLMTEVLALAARSQTKLAALHIKPIDSRAGLPLRCSLSLLVPGNQCWRALTSVVACRSLCPSGHP